MNWLFFHSVSYLIILCMVSLVKQLVTMIFIDENCGKVVETGLASLFRKVQDAVSSLLADGKNPITIVVDDISLMEIAANGCLDDVLSFMHYCHTLTSEFVSECCEISMQHLIFLKSSFSDQ